MKRHPTASAFYQLSAARISQLASQVLFWGLVPAASLAFGILRVHRAFSLQAWVQSFVLAVGFVVEFSGIITGTEVSRHCLWNRTHQHCLADSAHWTIGCVMHHGWRHFLTASTAGFPCENVGHLFDPHESSIVLGSQNAPSQTLAHGSIQHATKATSIVGGSLIVSEGLLIDIAIQVERGDGNVSAFEGPLEQGPEILNPVRMDLASHVGGQVVNKLVQVGQANHVVGRSGIGVDVGTRFNMLADVIDQSEIVGSLNHGSPNFPATFQQTLNDGLADWPASDDGLFPFVFVHVGSFTTDERLIDFNSTAQLSERAGFHGEPNAVQHEPRRFLSDLQGSGKLAAADPVLSVGNAPDRDKPLVEPQRGILENRVNDSPNG